MNLRVLHKEVTFSEFVFVMITFLSSVEDRNDFSWK